MRVCTLLLWAAALTSCAPRVQEPSVSLEARDDASPELQAVTVRGIGTGRACRRKMPAAALDVERSSSAVALVRRGRTTHAYVADADGRALLTIDVDGASLLASTALPGEPAHVLVLRDGRVAVTLRDTDRILVMEPRARATLPLHGLCEIDAPVEPFGLAVTPDHATVLVTGGWSARLAAFDARTFEPQFDVALAREPREIAIIDNGAKAFVAHVVGGRVSAVDLSPPHAVRTIDLRRPRRDAAVRLQRGERAELAYGSQGYALAAVDSSVLPERVYAPHVLVEPQMGFAYYAQGSEAPVVAALDPASEQPLARAAVALMPSAGITKHERCLLPRAAEGSDRGRLYLTCLGNDMLVELDARGADPARVQLRRWRVPAGPVGLAIDDIGGRAMVWSQFDRKLTMISLRGERHASIEAPALPPSRMNEVAQLGRRLFHSVEDPRMSIDGRGCASCHPDGRDDALVWPTEVGLRQTITLAGRMEGTAPYGWSGEHRSIAEHARETARRLGGRGMKDSDARAIAAYLASLPAPRAVVSEPGLVSRGRELFFGERQACADCHVEGASDGVRHDVGGGMRIDTPALRGVGRTAPYWHDGRFATLGELLTSPDLRMGRTHHLSRDDRDALVAYLESL